MEERERAYVFEDSMMEGRSTIAKPELLSRLSCSKSSEASPPTSSSETSILKLYFLASGAMPKFGIFESLKVCKEQNIVF